MIPGPVPAPPRTGTVPTWWIAAGSAVILLVACAVALAPRVWHRRQARAAVRNLDAELEELTR